MAVIQPGPSEAEGTPGAGLVWGGGGVQSTEQGSAAWAGALIPVLSPEAALAPWEAPLPCPHPRVYRSKASLQRDWQWNGAGIVADCGVRGCTLLLGGPWRRVGCGHARVWGGQAVASLRQW